MKKMWGKKLYTWLISTIVILLAFMIIMDSTRPGGADTLLSGIFEDMYTNANPSLQKSVYDTILERCGQIQSITPKMMNQQQEFCTSPEKRKQIEDFCTMFPTLTDQQKNALGPEKVAQAAVLCKDFTPAKLDEMCKQGNSVENNDIEILKKYCADFESSGWTKSEAFSNLAMSSLQLESVKSQVSQEKMAQLSALTTMSTNGLIMSIGAIIVCLGLLYLLLRNDPYELSKALGKMLLYLGLLFVIPFLLVKVYIGLAGVDTSFILDTLQNQSGAQAINTELIIKNALPLVIERMFVLTSVIIGFSCVIMGTVILMLGRTYFHPDEEKKAP
jgi:hypothetical protein